MMLDSFGVGAAHDAEAFGDVGSDTFGHIAKACAEGKANDGREGPLKLPNLARLGLGHASKESTGEFPAGFGGVRQSSWPVSGAGPEIRCRIAGC